MGKVITHADVMACPLQKLNPAHYRDDGSCLCRDVDEDQQEDDE